MVNTKKTYETPKLQVYGTLTEITQVLGEGDYLDAAFPINTKKVDLTFHS